MTAIRHPEGKEAQALRQVRSELMGGRGPGADPTETAAYQRNRVVVGGMSTTRRLELAARDTVRARGVQTELTSVEQRRNAERTHPEQHLGYDVPVVTSRPTGPKHARSTEDRGNDGRLDVDRADRHRIRGGVGVLLGWFLRRWS